MDNNINNFKPEKVKFEEKKYLEARAKWENDDANAKALKRFSEHFAAKKNYETYISSGAFIVGFGLSCFITK